MNYIKRYAVTLWNVNIMPRRKLITSTGR